jgi:hypothetical protein
MEQLPGDVIDNLILNGTQRLDRFKGQISYINQTWPNYDPGDYTYVEQVEKVRQTVPAVINDQTVASYLYGCAQAQPSGNTVCSPPCLNGFKVEDRVCNQTVYQKRDGNLTMLTGDESPSALVYLASGDTLTEADRTALLSDGKTQVILYQQQPGTINYAPSSMIDLNQPVTNPNTQTSNIGSYSVWIWIIVVLIVAVIIYLVWPKQY